jgi:hypothetical protein
MTAPTDYFRRELEIVDIVGGCERVEENGLFSRWIRQGVRRTGWHNDVVPCLGIYVLPVWPMESDRAFRHEERFVVHYMSTSQQ